MQRKVEFMGHEVTLENNALLPRMYRHKFGRDLIVDMQKLVNGYQKDPDNLNTEVLENIAWLMLKTGGEPVGDTPEEWLAGLDDPFAVYEIIGDVIDLWAAGRVTTSKVKKK